MVPERPDVVYVFKLSQRTAESRKATHPSPCPDEKRVAAIHPPPFSSAAISLSISETFHSVRNFHTFKKRYAAPRRIRARAQFATGLITKKQPSVIV